MPAFEPRNYPGVLHHYAPSLVAFEFKASSPDTLPPENTLLFISGLGDGLLTVPYSVLLAQRLLPLSYALVEVLITSSYTGWGTGSISRDAQELALCVSYFRKLRPSRGKIVLMGHSTGCQDTIEYLTGEGSSSRPPTDGAVLQAPVSDREAIQMCLSKEAYRDSVDMAKTFIANGRGSEILPSTLTGKVYGGTPCSALRWYSLVSPSCGEGDGPRDGSFCEDFFSSDLPDKSHQRTFGSISHKTPLCILISGADESMPSFVDKKALVRKWMEAVKEGGGRVDERYSGVVEGATHSLAENPEDIVEEFVGRVVGFLEGLKG